GCDRHYGSANVCVPTTFPAAVEPTTAARCDWLKEHDYGRLEVNGKDDPPKLDRDRDGTACGKGDYRHRRWGTAEDPLNHGGAARRGTPPAAPCRPRAGPARARGAAPGTAAAGAGGPRGTRGARRATTPAPTGGAHAPPGPGAPRLRRWPAGPHPRSAWKATA